MRSALTSLLALIIASPALAGTPSPDQAEAARRIEFTPPVTRRDGTKINPATDISHYTIFCRLPGASAIWPADGYRIPGMSEGGEHKTTNAELLGAPGIYECALTATDTSEPPLHSHYSAPVTVPWVEPLMAPTDVIWVVE